MPLHRPSFPIREAHAHLASYGRSLTMPSVGGCRSPADCIHFLRGVFTGPTTTWGLASGARVESWDPARWPTRHELDVAFGPRPVAIMSFDHHAVVANSAAMTAAAFHDASLDPPGGVIVRDANASPTGLLLESAAWSLWNAAPEPTAHERTLHVAAAVDALATLGFVEVHDLLAQPWLGPTLAELHDAGRLPLRVGLFAPFERIAHAKPHAKHDALAWQRPGLELLGGKLFCDGTLNSRTAWMLNDYREPLDGLPRGKPLLSVDEMSSAMARVHDLGLGLAIHAIGDGAVRAVLNARERTISAGVRPPLRIEHAELIDEADVPRFAALGAVASLQPCHLLTDIEVLERQLPHRLDRVLPIRELADAGLVPGETLIFGSDVPIVRPDPEDSILAATQRRRPDMDPSAAIAPRQALTHDKAWSCFRATSS